MKYVCVLLFLWLGGMMQVAGQIRLEGCEYKENTYYDGNILYAIKDTHGSKNFGKIVFTPIAGDSGWNFSWSYNGGLPQPGSAADTSFLEIEIPGDGFYILQAERGDDLVQAHFHVFYDHVPDFTIQLGDIYNCTAISIDPITDFVVPVYRYHGIDFYGSGRNVYYLVSDKTVPREFPNYEYAFMKREEAVAVGSENMTLTVTITDLFGFEWTSQPATYTSVIPKAVWEPEILNPLEGAGEKTGQAPLQVEFHNSSENAQEYYWYLYKDTIDLHPMMTLEDSLMNNEVRREEEFDYTYEHTGYYRVQMVAVNTVGLNHCWDTLPSQFIRVVESLVDVPNVFTPNGDGINDVFKAKTHSVESFKGVILNRWGRQVFEWTSPEEGWDGRIHGKYATPGTYYYIITARGLEKYNPPRYVKKGALLLVR